VLLEVGVELGCAGEGFVVEDLREAVGLECTVVSSEWLNEVSRR
jgi:hypothetical protein